MSIFLTETTTRHSLLTKHKHFHDTTQMKLTSNSGRLTGATNEAPIDVDLDAAMAPITLRREDSDDDETAVMLAAIPAAAAAEAVEASAASGRPKRARANTTDTDQEAGRQGEAEDSEFEVISSDESDGADGARSGEESDTPGQPPHKRRKEVAAGERDGDDKKKLAMDISYEGFSIYGRVLCLVVKRRDIPSAVGSGGRVASGAGGPSKTKQGGPGGQTMMENFIISTQMPAGDDMLDYAP